MIGKERFYQPPGKEKDMLTNLTQQQWRLVIQLVRLYRARPIAKLSELLQGEGRLLLYLLEQQGQRVAPSTASHNLGLSRPRITYILNALRRKGYVDVNPNKFDRRKVDIVLTPRGRDCAMRHKRELEYLLNQLSQQLGNDEMEQLIRLLTHINQMIHLLPTNTEERK